METFEFGSSLTGCSVVVLVAVASAAGASALLVPPSALTGVGRR
jgi:hypothetical protein